jgi:beta-glucosidase
VTLRWADGPWASFIAEHYHRSAPLEFIKANAPQADVTYRTGRYIADAVAAAKKAEVAIVFATKWATEGLDQADLTLPNGQDALIAAVAAANPNTIVVLETGNPVLMPWLDKVAAVVEAWFPARAAARRLPASCSVTPTLGPSADHLPGQRGAIAPQGDRRLRQV